MKLLIEHDYNPSESPRDWDNVGIMVCFHKRYDLGDKTELKSSMFEGWDEMEEHLRREEGAEIILPLYLYDHSGITMNTTGFSCGWDSGQVGFIYTTRKKIFGEYPKLRRLTKKLRERVEKTLRREVKSYDQYLTGDVWGYVIEDDDGEIVDSCWGIYGRDCAEEEGRSALHHLALANAYDEHMREKCTMKITE